MFYLRTLDDTAWSIADVTGPIGTGTHIFEINFTANDQEYNSIRFVDGADSGKIYFGATLVNEYPQGGWVNTAYQNVKIAGGVDATNPSLLSWFRQNAKNLTPSNDDASITQALQNIAEAISGGGGGGGLPDPSEASAGDVLSLDEDKKPTWAAPSGGGGRVVKCTGTAAAIEPGIIIPLDIYPEEFIAAFTAATASPLYILLPRITAESPYYSYDDEGAPDWFGMYLIDGRSNGFGNYKINSSQDYVTSNARVSDLSVVIGDSLDDQMLLLIPSGK